MGCKYTPGPWKMKKRPNWRVWTVYHYQKNKLSPGGTFPNIATIASGPNPTTPLKDNEIEAKANARLIAAAPDLLETCKWVLGCLNNLPYSDDSHSAKQELESVIALAEGTK